MDHARPARFWLWPNLLSLDAPLVAVLWQYLFARCLHASIGFESAIVLLLTVWLIYSADRTLDALRGRAESYRHEFYRKHWRALAPMWLIVLAAVAGIAVFRLPRAMFGHGLLLLVAVVVYFSIVHVYRGDSQAQYGDSNPFPAKEFAVGILFALGASLVTWASVKTAADVATILLFAGLCAINCVAIQRWDCSGQQSSIAWATISVGLAAGILLVAHRPILGGAEIASAAALLVLDREKERFSRNALRVLADVAMLSPIFFLPVAGLL